MTGFSLFLSLKFPNRTVSDQSDRPADILFRPSEKTEIPYSRRYYFLPQARKQLRYKWTFKYSTQAKLLKMGVPRRSSHAKSACKCVLTSSKNRLDIKSPFHRSESQRDTRSRCFHLRRLQTSSNQRWTRTSGLTYATLARRSSSA
jgi:hypothetical protein